MSCSTVQIARYIVVMSGKGIKVPVPLMDIVSISGLGMGDQGTITLTQQDRIVELPDGIRRLPQLTLSFRFDSKNPSSVFAKDKLFEWYNKRNTQTYDLDVFITNRTFCPQHGYRYLGSSIKNITENDKSMGKADLSIITAVFIPYDVIALTNTAEAITAWNIPARVNIAKPFG